MPQGGRETIWECTDASVIDMESKIPIVLELTADHDKSGQPKKRNCKPQHDKASDAGLRILQSRLDRGSLPRDKADTIQLPVDARWWGSESRRSGSEWAKARVVGMLLRGPWPDHGGSK